MIAQAARGWFPTAEIRIQPLVSSSEFRGRICDTGVVFLRVLPFPPLITIPPLLHTHLSPPHAVCDSPDQAEHYHTLGPKLRASSLTRHLPGLEVKVVYCFLSFY
jgi:hypothetical protein